MHGCVANKHHLQNQEKDRLWPLGSRWWTPGLLNYRCTPGPFLMIFGALGAGGGMEGLPWWKFQAATHILSAAIACLLET